MCCESQDISSGMRKIENWSDQFGTEIALGRGIFVQGYSRVTREVGGRICQSGGSDWELLWFDGVSRGGTNGGEYRGRGSRIDYAGH